MIERDESKKDLLVVIIGFFFILAVSTLFFLKFYFFDQKKDSQNRSRSSIEAAVDFSGIAVSDLAKKITAKERLVIFDLRDSDSFATEHIADSKNLSSANLSAIIPTLDKNGTYFFVDELGLTPGEIQALQFFKDNGFAKIAYLEGGLTRWKNDYEATVSGGDPYSLADQAKVSYLSSDELEKEISDKKPLVVIDVRSKAAFDQGHIPGAMNVYLSDLESRRHELPSGTKIILCDDNGQGAFQGAVRLFDLGILNVYALSDGLNAWKQKKFSLVAH